MGGFINSQADNEICEVLNKRFSDEVNPDDPQGRTYIALLRDHFRNRENFLDGNHHLHRVFHRFAINVAGRRVPRQNQSRFRWLFLLRSNLPAAVMKAIRGQLSAILGPATAGNPAGAVDYATFSTRHIATGTGTFELWPQNSVVPTIQTDANRKRYCTIILDCHADVPLPDSPNETDPPTPDNGETSFAARKVLPKKPAGKYPAAKKFSAKKSASKKKPATRKRQAKS
jgi:hypothetical protein